ncbi:uncharacterized protein TNCT_343491 [Trichonephila clavata]|uniref:Uncharacterized protein n=1 Tax=Trichonephila clavata TaxID=2740835 RepID=A0A8X6KDY4_TRICU|nr:uncharacterized protein TNCT_343491 [Trichonephila clavata]
MKIQFRPSLQLIVLVRIAKKILYSLYLRVDLECFPPIDSVITEYSNEIASTIKNLFSGQNIPSFTEKQIFGIVRSLNSEIHEWLYDHKEILSCYDRYLFESLCWLSYGIIDRPETALRLIQDANVKTKERFVLSCAYFFDDHAEILWEQMSPFDRRCIIRKYRTMDCIKYRTDKLRQVTSPVKINSIQMFDHIKDKNYFSDNSLGLRCFFKEMNPDVKYLCLSYHIERHAIHHFDLYLCFAEMDIWDLKSIFCTLNETHRFWIFKSLLKFPLQYLFADVVTQLGTYISRFNFRNVLHFILYKRMQEGWHDFDYIPLMKYLWLNYPKGHRSSYKKDKSYDLFERVVWTPPEKDKH